MEGNYKRIEGEHREIRARIQDWFGRIAVLIRITRNNRVSIGETIIMREIGTIEETANMVSPISHTFDMTKSEAQLLMDDLWNCGIRPSDRVPDVKQFLAVERHLGDMRRIAGKFLHITFKEE